MWTQFPLSLSTASMGRMVPRQAAAPWIRRRILGWCSTLLSPRVSAGSPSCTAQTRTMTRPPKPCRATPPSTVRGKHEAFTLDPSWSRQKGSTLFQIWSVYTHIHTHTPQLLRIYYSHQHSHGCDCNYAIIMLMKSWWILLAVTVALCFLAFLSESFNQRKPSISRL